MPSPPLYLLPIHPLGRREENSRGKEGKGGGRGISSKEIIFIDWLIELEEKERGGRDATLCYTASAQGEEKREREGQRRENNILDPTQNKGVKKEEEEEED